GDQPAVPSGSESDDVIAGPVAAAAGADQFRSGQPTGGFHPLPGPLVEGGDVGPPPRVQAGLMSGRDVGSPGVDGFLEGDVPLGCRVQPALTRVPRDGFGDATSPQLGQGATFGRVVLAAVLGQLVHDVGVAAHQRAECTAGADRPQLVVVADE